MSIDSDMFLCSFAANHKEILWNGKFLFAFPAAEWEHINHLKLKIIEAEYFTDGRFVGETMYDYSTLELKFYMLISYNFERKKIVCVCVGFYW